MAENEYIGVEPKKKEKKKKIKSNKKPFKLKTPTFMTDPRFKLSVGALLIVISISLFFAFVSYLFTGKADQSVIYDDSQTISELGENVENKIGYSGSFISHYFINRWFGLGSFAIIPVIFMLGLSLITGKVYANQVRFSKAAVFAGIWVSVLMGYVVSVSSADSNLIYYCGGTGFYIADFLNNLLGWGTFLILGFVLLVFLIYFLDLSELVGIKKKVEEPVEGYVEVEDEEEQEEHHLDEVPENELVKKVDNELELVSLDVDSKPLEDNPVPTEPSNSMPLELETEEIESSPVESKFGVDTSDFTTVEQQEKIEDTETEEELDIEVAAGVEEKESRKSTAINTEDYDPTLDLSHYQYPTINLLQETETGKVQVSREELEANKNKIVETLSNYKIGISHIKATIGPTVTLYEIIPESGVRISKIKNLEDDIALSLAALGIRIIAPIPGKGTIGIEVPNTQREMVGFRSLLKTEKFIKSKMALPVVMGKTITNEVFMLDLAKMPHVLMAGATGQGKSVGLNIILASLLYKKHPSQLKFVLVDPKKVELSIFSKIERHFLAKLPDEEEAIITDTSKVINTLNSLCIEMDNRYELLKQAGCRNLKEYNGKFVERKLNPEKGHQFMPYIVLVIDELADLMMTAGKEVETPIARLAQLARAIGIHLVVATQRPSVNVITGIIKANFPARISFKVTSKIDSRTILDSGGADQLIGMGDMLFSQGSEIIRVQCGFVDTPEIDSIVNFIGEQQGYSTAFLLPEYVGEGGDGQDSNVDLKDRDVMFEEAARVIVSNQQGSTSLIQRKLKLGYNRAGRIVDQLEAAGVVGPSQGSKAREVYIQDEYSLEQLLNSL